jgi:metal-sulfur cluster biosynthetic enzyme
MSTIDERRVLETVNSVVDPCSRLSGVPGGLVDMGMVTEVRVLHDADGVTVDVTIQLTEPTCIMGHAFIPQVGEALRQLDGVVSANVHLDLSFGWEPSRLSAAYQERLSASRQPGTDLSEFFAGRSVFVGDSITRHAKVLP